SGTSHLSTAEVARLAHLDGRTNVLWLSPSKVRTDLRRDPWIAGVQVHRFLPGALALTIVERRPIAVAQPGDWLVGADGVVIGLASRHSGLPSVRPGVALRSGAVLSLERLSLAVARSLPAKLRSSTLAIDTHRGGQVALR